MNFFYRTAQESHALKFWW